LKILGKFGKELFWTMFWVFIALIIGYFILGWLAGKNIPLLSNISSWVETHSTPQ
jgi:hypothetical protein